MNWHQAVNSRLLNRFGIEVRRVQPPPPQGALPDFIIIGAQKGGTTSLFHYLAQHPQILRSKRKEVHYFDGGLNPRVDRYAKGLDWYRTQFPPRPASGGHKVFEASPFYLFSPPAPARIAEVLPNAKLITVLRDPVDRAISHYFHAVRRGNETLPIEEAMRIEEERLAGSKDGGNFNTRAYKTHSYKTRGRYHEQLRRYYDQVPAENMLVLSSERMFKNLDATLRQVFEFIGVDPNHAVVNQAPRNVSHNRTPVDDGLRDWLADYFRPHNEALYELVNEDYGWRK